jgi:hypothetical protein
MPLRRFRRRCTLTTTQVSFAMVSSDGKTVPIHVRVEALQQLAPSDSRTHEAKFYKYRDRLEEIARIKFDHGLVQPDGSIEITTDDLMQ